MPVKAQAFPKKLRLLTRREFLRVQDKGAKVAVGPFLALALPNTLGFTRIGLTVSTKVGPAVERVRIRRQLRELFRKRRDELPQGLDLVFIARSSAVTTKHDGFVRAFNDVVRKLPGVKKP